MYACPDKYQSPHIHYRDDIAGFIPVLSGKKRRVEPGMQMSRQPFIGQALDLFTNKQQEIVSISTRGFIAAVSECKN